MDNLALCVFFTGERSIRRSGGQGAVTVSLSGDPHTVTPPTTTTKKNNNPPIEKNGRNSSDPKQIESKPGREAL